MRQTGLPDYDAVVDDYETYAEPATAAFGARALALAAVRPGKHVLDIAAGTGAVTLPLLDAGARVTAVDLSAPMVARLAARIGARDGEALVMDGQALTFPDDRFDVALSIFGIMLFPDFRAGLREMARVLRPGGRCVVGSWTGWAAPMRTFREALADALPGSDLPEAPEGMEALGIASGMTAELARAGLEPIGSRSVTLPWISPPLERLAREAGGIFGMMPQWRDRTDVERRRIVEAIERMAARDRHLRYESTAIFGLARKPDQARA